ncbi:MAG: DUF3618 domain-containing protein [Magnetospiraceae bacterium]
MSSSSKTADQIEEEIEKTHADIERTLESVRDKFSPGEIIDQALAATQGRAGVAAVVGRAVRDHPVPALIAAASVAWIAFAPRKAPGDAEKQDAVARRSAETAADSQDAETSLSEAPNRDSRADWAAAYRQISDEADRTTLSRMGRFISENPLVTGIMGVSVGAVLAALLPPSRRRLGALYAQGKSATADIAEVGGEKMTKVSQAMRAATDAGEQEASRRSLDPDHLKQRAEHLAEDVAAVIQAALQAGESSLAERAEQAPDNRTNPKRPTVKAAPTAKAKGPNAQDPSDA